MFNDAIHWGAVGEPPCRKCKERYEACHASCELYLLWTKRKDELHEKAKAYRSTEAQATKFALEGSRRQKNYRNALSRKKMG